MLAYIRCGKTSGTSAYSYLYMPDINNGLWKTRGKGETNGFLCNMEIKLTEELKTYLTYFLFGTGKNLKHTLTSFSNIPLKPNVKVPGNLNT